MSILEIRALWGLKPVHPVIGSSKAPVAAHEGIGRILAVANEEELTSIFKLQMVLSQKIVQLRPPVDKASLKWYREKLRPDEISTIERTFTNLTQHQLDVFYRGRHADTISRP
jgi:hypothetical protein